MTAGCTTLSVPAPIFVIGLASAAYLKFLHHKRRILFRNFK